MQWAIWHLSNILSHLFLCRSQWSKHEVVLIPHIQTPYFQLDTISCQCIRRLFYSNIISQSICLSNIPLTVATSEHSDETGIATSAPNIPGQSPFKSAIQVTTPQGSPDTVLNTSHKTSHERERLSTGQISGVFFHYYALPKKNLMLYPVNVNLGSSYIHRFKYTGDLQEIEHAISHFQKAVESTPSGHADLPSWLSNLGNAYFLCFKHTGHLQDIEHAIFYLQKAMESTPSGHANLPSCLSTLGSLYILHFEHTGHLQDIDTGGKD